MQQIQLLCTNHLSGEAFLQSFKTFFLTAANVGKAVWDFGTEPFRILAEASGKVLSGVGK